MFWNYVPVLQRLVYFIVIVHVKRWGEAIGRAEMQTQRERSKKRGVKMKMGVGGKVGGSFRK